jgi:hypothetical protein
VQLSPHAVSSVFGTQPLAKQHSLVGQGMVGPQEFVHDPPAQMGVVPEHAEHAPPSLPQFIMSLVPGKHPPAALQHPLQSDASPHVMTHLPVVVSHAIPGMQFAPLMQPGGEVSMENAESVTEPESTSVPDSKVPSTFDESDWASMGWLESPAPPSGLLSVESRTDPPSRAPHPAPVHSPSPERPQPHAAKASATTSTTYTTTPPTPPARRISKRILPFGTPRPGKPETHPRRPVVCARVCG